MKFIILFFVLIVVFILAIAFGANNDQAVTFNYLFAQDEFRLSTLLALLFGSGFLVGWFFTGFFLIKTKLKLSSAERKLKKVQSSLDKEIEECKKNELIDSSIITDKKA